MLGLLIFMMLALLVIYVFSYPKLRIEDITKAVFVFLYVSVLFSYIARTRDLVAGNWLVWLIIISAWGSDTFAYVTGVLIGKHHFSELSPKKRRLRAALAVLSVPDCLVFAMPFSFRNMPLLP